jgi:quercetin dioxygenase-like cupin family protein
MKKVIYGVLMLGWVPTLALVSGLDRTDALFAQGRTPIKVTRIYTGADGKTKVEESTIPLKPRDGGSETSASIPVTSMQFRHTTPAYNLDWHPAPRRQIVVTLSGESEIELEGGRKMRFGPGHILLAEDTTGQGHKSRAVPGTDRVALDIALAEGATLPK